MKNLGARPMYILDLDFLHIDNFPCPQNKFTKTTRAMTPVDALFLFEELEITTEQLEVHFSLMLPARLILGWQQ